jgi:hypothetical protein
MSGHVSLQGSGIDRISLSQIIPSEIKMDIDIFRSTACSLSSSVYNPGMLPDLQLKDIVRMRKAHPCGSYEWTVTRLGADIGLECKGCGRRVMLTRRELARRAKTIYPRQEKDAHEPE